MKARDLAAMLCAAAVALMLMAITMAQAAGVEAEFLDGPGGKTRQNNVVRTVQMADHLHARTMRNHFDEGDPAVFAGTTPGVSADIVNELFSGRRAAMSFLDQRPIFGLPSVRRLRPESDCALKNSPTC